MSQDHPPPDRLHIAWLIIWTVWGAVVGLLVYLFDGEAIAGLNWLSAGAFIGSCGIRILRPLATPLHEWYERQAGGERYLDRMMEVMLEGNGEEVSQEELRERLERYQQSREFQQSLENSLYGVTLVVSPLFGLFYGILGGGVMGALCPISPELHVTSGRGALLGIMLGPLFISFIASTTCAVMYPVPKYSPRSVDRSRRMALLVSPVLIAPAVLHSLRRCSLRRGFVE